MTIATAEPLPKGWQWGQWDERVAALRPLPHRATVLLAAEWARSVLSVFEARYPQDARPRKAIEAAEQWARVPTAATAATAAAARAAADAAARAAAADAAATDAAAATAAATAADAAATARAAAATADAAATAAATAADAAATAARAAAAADAAARAKWRWIYRTYCWCRGPVGVAFDPAWRTSDAVALARGIVADRAFDRFPILADALEDAACTAADHLAHLRADVGEWTGADWSLWSLLGYGE